jgi:hypothetical protein
MAGPLSLLPQAETMLAVKVRKRESNRDRSVMGLGV